MEHSLFLLTLTFSVSAAFSFNIVCISAGVSFCAESPVACKVSLDTDLCVAGVDIFSVSDLTVTLTDSSIGSISPSYNLTQNNSVMIIVTGYVPSSNLSEITVNVQGNLTSNCTFNLTFADSVQRTVTLCSNSSLSLELLASSSSSTNETSLAVNEVFQILLELTLPSGKTIIHVETSITAQEDDDIPIEILDIEEITPVSVLTNSFIGELEDLEIIWDLGTVLNTNDSAVVVGLLYTAVILDQNTSGLTLQFSATLYADGVMVSTATGITATLVMPLLSVYKSFSIAVDTDDSLVFEVTTVISHDNASTSPAFLVWIHELVPEIFEVILPYFLEIDGDKRSLDSYELSGDVTFLNVRIRRVQLQSKVTLTYLAHFKPFRHFDEITAGTVIVNYSTIIQEGIGLLYDFRSERRSIHTDICFNKIVDIHTYRDGADRPRITAVTVSLLSGPVLVVVIALIVLIVCYCIRIARFRQIQRVVPSSSALVAVVIGKSKKENEEHLIFKNRKRPLFSSLLDALPKKTWNVRDDVHECREADYIADAEGSLLYAKGQMIIHLFKYFLQSKTALSKEDITRNTDVFELKVNILQKTLMESVKSQLENAALQHGADKILKEGEQESKHREADATITDTIPKNLSNFSEVLQHIQEQNAQETGDVLDLIEITAKKEKFQIIRQHTMNYLLGLKAIVSNILQEAAVHNKDEIIGELYCALEHGEKLIHKENDKLNEMADIRGRRQKLVLLDKKLVEEADERWEMLLQKQVDKSVTELISCQKLPSENRNVARKDLEQVLLKEFRLETANRLQEEMRLSRAAKEELNSLERQVSKPSKRQYYTDYKEMLETEFQKWHDKQKKKEEALKQVEDKVYNGLKKTWETWSKKRDAILSNFTLPLTAQLQIRGLQSHQITSLMQEHAKGREELEESLKTSRLVQKARFQARVNQLQEKFYTLMEQSDSLFAKKMEVERKHLEKIKEAFSNMKHDDPTVFEEYNDNINKLEGSLSVEKLNIHINLKEKFAERRKNTFQSILHEFLEKKDERKDEEELKVFLEKRRDAVFEMCTRSYEEERKKAEEEIAQAKDKILSAKKPPAIKIHTPARVQAGPSRVQLTTEPAEIQDETKVLLDSHKEDLAKLSNKLEDDRKKAMQALEQKMIQKRIRREKAVEQLMKPDWSQYRGSKFKQLVQKQILSTRVEKIRKQNAESLSDAMDALQKEFDGKKQDAKEKLEKKLETHLVESGKASSEQLVEVFEELHRTQLPSDLVTSESATDQDPLLASLVTSESTAPDPLLVNRSKQRVLPPIIT